VPPAFWTVTPAARPESRLPNSVIGASWVIAAASGALAVWMGELAYRALR